jgi:pimeloyl-ACP methyl ester carboxylesterase
MALSSQTRFCRSLTSLRLPTGYQVICYHRRGVAGSTHPDSAVSIADQAADAAGLLAHLSVERVHVVGHSYGAAIGLQLALDSPQSVHSVALLEPPLFVVPSAAVFAEGMNPSVEKYMAGDKGGAVKAFLSYVGGADWESLEAAIESRIPGGVDQAVNDADMFFRIEMPALQEWSFGPEQAMRIGQPVLALIGSESLDFFREARSVLHSWLPQTEDADVEAGHFLQMQNSAGVAQALAGFLRRHPRE